MLDLQPGDHESLDSLIGDWNIFQLRKGHRFSTDDLVCAWRASRESPHAKRLLDIGSGIGSVGLATLFRMDRAAVLTTIEAQEVSYSLARRTAAYNGLDNRVSLHLGDLRDETVLEAGSQFDLITGSPPYIPEGHGVMSPIPQRAGARMELRGSIYDYCAAARRWLAPGGRFTFVMAAQDPRTEDAPAKNGLSVVERWDYVFAARRAPHIATLVCARIEDQPPPRRSGTLIVRGLDGRWTPEYLAFREEMGSPTNLSG